jgi:hypothetical protein
MHQRVCREANVMARSSAFDASFCSRSIISILVQQKPGDGIARKRFEMPLMRLKQCHERRKLLVESANLNSNWPHRNLQLPPLRYLELVSAAAMTIGSKDRYTYGPLPMMAVEFDVVECRRRRGMDDFLKSLGMCETR